MKYFLLIIIGVALTIKITQAQIPIEFYIDPDWTGTKSGTQSEPWSTLNVNAWTAINNALVNGDVIVYFSALESDGTTQETIAKIDVERSNTNTNRLTIDGYAKYNTNDIAPNWANNPTLIENAYIAGKVLKLTGQSSSALGWWRGSTYPKQDYITMRGFEITGSGARTGFAGDYVIAEYLYIHDITTIGPAIHILYTFNDIGCDDVVLDRIMPPSHDMIIRNVRIVNNYGEAIYVGSVNPDCPTSIQCAMGNEHSDITIENVYISGAGINGAQGDGIDLKNGLTNVTIRNVEITSYRGMGGIILPKTYTPTVNQNILIENVYIHDSANSGGGGTEAEKAINGTSGTNPNCSWGYNGITIRNNIIDTNKNGIDITGSDVFENIYIYNNTVYNNNSMNGILLSGVDANAVIRNNLVFNNDGNEVSFSGTGIDSDYNAYYGIWGYASEGSNSINMTLAQRDGAIINAAAGNFQPVLSSILINVGALISSFSNDYIGVIRPQGSVWDIGAYEYVEVASPPPPPDITPPVAPIGLEVQ